MSLLPTNREIAPPRPLVDEPVLIVTAPLASPSLGAVAIFTAPESPIVAAPLVICTAPPSASADAPAVKEMSLPAPTVLAPTDKLMAPPTANSEEPLVMEIAPAAPLLAPDSKDRDPEEKLAVAVLAPVAIEMEPVFWLAATPSAD